VRGRERRNAGRCAQYVVKLALAQGLADATLGELVLADDVLGVDPEQHVHAVPGPFGDLGRVDAAVEPRGQAGMPQVVGSPGRGRG
jgi:hypothetical protein